ncbi:putative D-aminoacylase [Diplogelasinospora grovesii]|uniref:D-aminoacylase n=1 Tax=Diplogelasinospora grovesii TaxID=303347 RepID=A0AAN6N5E4_9PEZI|nr:putative D-aminoacylase [Diplogelasinospora grovesii]
MNINPYGKDRTNKALKPTIREICSICGVAGVSIGVTHRGEVIYKESFGFRDVEGRIKGDDDTIYYLGSMTKGFTAEAVGILAEEGKLKGRAPSRTSSPDSNRTTMLSTTTAQSNNKILLTREQALRTINQLRAVTPFRGEYRYNNWGYEIAGRVIENITEKRFSEFPSEKIFEPLGMARTFNNDSECHGSYNVAKGYMTFDDASPYPVPRPHMAEGTLMNPAGVIQSTVNDLLKYYVALMKSLNDQYQSGKTSTPGSPLKQLTQVLSTNIRTAPSLREQSYAMGWARVQLPGRLCDTSRNQVTMPRMPVIGNPEHPRLTLYHHGMLVGFNNAVHLFPETETAVLLLSNAVATNDGSDWIGHLIIQTLFNDPVKHDYVALARDTLAFGLETYDRIDLGKCYNEVKTFFMDISLKGDELWMNLQGNAVENYRLKHHNGDEFS